MDINGSFTFSSISMGLFILQCSIFKAPHSILNIHSSLALECGIVLDGNMEWISILGINVADFSLQLLSIISDNDQSAQSALLEFMDVQ